MIQFKENARTDGRKDGRKDGQTLFYRILPATARGSKKLSGQKVIYLSTRIQGTLCSQF